MATLMSRSSIIVSLRLFATLSVDVERCREGEMHELLPDRADYLYIFYTRKV
jgi:hypothetical protein